MVECVDDSSLPVNEHLLSIGAEEMVDSGDSSLTVNEAIDINLVCYVFILNPEFSIADGLFLISIRTQVSRAKSRKSQ